MRNWNPSYHEMPLSVNEEGKLVAVIEIRSESNSIVFGHVEGFRLEPFKDGPETYIIDMPIIEGVFVEFL
jgi:hypothetical protein